MLGYAFDEARREDRTVAEVERVVVSCDLAARASQVKAGRWADQIHFTAAGQPFEQVIMPKVSAVICYHQNDEIHLRMLEAHLASLCRENLLDLWHRGHLRPGDECDVIVAQKLASADLIFFSLALTSTPPMTLRCLTSFAVPVHKNSASFPF
ncbi:hypothetical protein [Sorangium sp. So ce117]|uniref:hypothetical protein n=1 Tax=Sorangium sp. So ce117 TaxID=3133277 RepID=UPI003F627892